MLLSVVVCIYNGEDTLKVLLESLKRQTLNPKNYEIILVNDGSKDLSTHVCEEFVNENPLYNIYYFGKDNEGLSAARNYGISKAAGDIIVFIDQDAAANKTWAENIIEEFKRESDKILISGPTLSFKEDTQFSKHVNRFNYSRKSGIKRVIGTNMAFRKNFFDNNGGFFDIFNHAGDETALIEIRKISKGQIGYCENMIVRHHFPNTFRRWLKEKKTNGEVSCLIESMKQGRGQPKFQIKHLIKYSYFSIPIIMLLSNGLKFFSIIPAFLLFARVGENFIGFRETMKIYRFSCIPHYLKAFAITAVGLVYTDIGFIKSWISIKEVEGDIEYSSYKGIVED